MHNYNNINRLKMRRKMIKFKRKANQQQHANKMASFY